MDDGNPHHNDSDKSALRDFIARWSVSGAAERANYQLFLSELCDLLDVPRPDPSTPDNQRNAYVFERAVVFNDGAGGETTKFIDLYRRSTFVLEAKQGADAPDTAEPLSTAARELKKKLRKGVARRGSAAWDDAMVRARGQAEQYIRALPVTEGRPPFIVVVDVGHSIELFAEFSCTGGTYVPFPAPGAHRILLADLERGDIRARLREVWLNPLDLDPAKRSARVTREIADRLAKLAVSLEKAGHAPQTVASFLMRCLFTMFAEDVNLIGRGSFTRLLESLKDNPEHFQPMVAELWSKMDRGGFSTSLRMNILQFNGGLYADASAIPLNRDQVQLLIEASACDWGDVEPAIFGTLLERALDPVERHKLGAHYTPRAYVERLVMPTIIEPVREEWEAVHAASIVYATAADFKKAIAELKTFHKKLCSLRVLDPACGSGNFLYVTLEHFKRIEGEVLDLLRQFGERQGVLDLPGETVDPHQFLGLEINPRAAAIAELVLWIGALQWFFRTRGNVRPPQPIIRDFHNIVCRDALIDYDRVEPVLDAEGNPRTRWDGRATKPHPVTGRELPDESVRTPLLNYINPRRAVWPETDYIVGNPPFIGPAMMRQALGDGYTDAVRNTHDDVGESSDFVMYWWNHAAQLAREGKIHRFGFVTTNSLRQTFNRRVIETHLNAVATSSPERTRFRVRATIDGNPGPGSRAAPEEKETRPLSIIFAIPDHPWVDAADGAAVRIAMTTGAGGEHTGVLAQVIEEKESGGDGFDVQFKNLSGKVHADLTVGANVVDAVELRSNSDISSRGVQVIGSGFIVTPEEASTLGLNSIAGLNEHIRPYRNGRDLAASPRNVMVIDLFGLTADQVRQQYPVVYQWVLERVKPERDQNNREGYKKNWWIHGEARGNFRPALAGLSRYIATVETSKHRFFVFLDASILPDNMLVNIALDDAYALGVLSSRIHVCWALKAGGRLGVGNDPRYNKTRCFETFPFPAATSDQQQRIRDLAEQLDAHRKRQQAQHSDLTMTGMYNVLEKLCSGVALTAKDKKIHEQGLVSVLKQLHDDLDAAVFAAYGWPADLPDDEILTRLVALNAERAREEASGHIRWLRPDFQNKSKKATQTEIDIETIPKSIIQNPKSKTPWPKTLPDQMRLVRQTLTETSGPLTATEIAQRFTRARVEKVEELLQTLVTLGQARELVGGKFET